MSFTQQQLHWLDLCTSSQPQTWFCLRHDTYGNWSVISLSQSSSRGKKFKGFYILLFPGRRVVQFFSKLLPWIQINPKTNWSWRPQSDMPITKTYKQTPQRREFVCILTCLTNEGLGTILDISGWSWWLGEVPEHWRKENITPIFKKGPKGGHQLCPVPIPEAMATHWNTGRSL